MVWNKKYSILHFESSLGSEAVKILIDGFRIRFHRLSALRNPRGFYGSWLAALFANMQRKSKREQPVRHALKIWINDIVKSISAATVFFTTNTTIQKRHEYSTFATCTRET
ncbi:MAG: hypothetical protein CMI66_08010 [Pedosphaera sp.]|nr:hypothetical protein [Pedosphaera sp.]HBP57417.1 hypothetical protein [Verrucomicrobiales bacterium]HCZ02192.1 hypothetical protein [Verrucomicrobiales bacterium]